MIVCPNCNHSNPDGAQACEACYTPLPATTTCPNCGASVQTDATFCGQCGSNLQRNTPTEATTEAAIATDIPDLVSPQPIVQTEPIVIIKTPASSLSESSPSPAPTPPPPTVSPQESGSTANVAPPIPTAAEPVTSEQVSSSPPPPPSATPSGNSRTQLQQQTAKLLHVQTNTIIELQPNLSVIHLGKPNDRIPPDVDVSGFPNSEIVSRIHADIRVEGDAFYIEDVGSANGTYINNLPLLPGNRHRLRVGDRIALGKGDLVTLLFQLA